MDASYDKNFPHAFVLGEEDLKKLTALFAESVGDIKITADCSDDVTRYFKTAEELAGYENPKAKQIRRLRIAAQSSDFRSRAVLTLSNSGWRGTTLQIEGPDTVVTHLRDKTLDIIDGMIPWYSLLSRLDFALMSLILYVAFWWGALALIGFGWIRTDQSQEVKPANSALFQLIVYGGIGLLILWNIWMYRFRDRVFPRGVYLIGQGKKRYDVLEKVQWGVVIGFFVSLAAGVPLLLW